jgi:serine/threonine protein phosphatase PrpC
MNSLSKDTIEGKLHTRGDSSKHKGDYKKIVEAVNRALDAVIGPLNVATESVDRISKGDIPKKITDKYNGDFNKTKNNLNMCINNINALSADTNLLAKAALEGNLSTRADATKHKGDYRKIIEDLNKMLDAIVGSLNITVKYIDRISNREIPPKITDKYNGDFNVSKDCINKLIDTCLQEKAKVNDKMVTQANPTAPIGDTPTEPQWQNLEPKEINDPTPHSLKFLSDYNNYLGIGASIRGKYHAHNGLYREDSFKFGHSNGWIIVAVADGAGSAKLSRVGSTLACKILVEYLELHLERCDIVASDDGLQPSEAFLTDIRSILVDAVTASQKKLIEESSARKIETKELASTLLVAIHKKWKDWHFIAGLQIGDGSIVFWDGKDTVRKLGNADSGQYASETVFITSKGNDQNLVNRVFFFLWKDIKSIALMTDGVADDFFPEEKMMPEMFRAIQDKFADTKQGLDTSLLDWLGYERRGSFDDRTIAIINNKS